jgi:hypothetical protein
MHDPDDDNTPESCDDCLCDDWFVTPPIATFHITLVLNGSVKGKPSSFAFDEDVVEIDIRDEE